MATPTQIDWARLAAYIDGEGCIRFKLNGSGHRCSAMEVCVSNTDYRLLVWLRDTFGGNVVSGTGKDKKRKREIWRWVVFNQNAVEILRNCMPFFIMKARQAEVAIAFRVMVARQKVQMAYGPRQKRPAEFDAERIALMAEMVEARTLGTQRAVN